MGINWEDILNCHDGDKLQDAYEDEINNHSSYQNNIPDPGDDNSQYLKYPVCEILYEAYQYTFDYLIEKCKAENMSENQIKDFFQTNLDYSADEIDDELNDYNHYGYISKDLYRASKLFYKMLRYVMKNYELKKCTKSNILHFLADPEDFEDYSYLINEMSDNNPNNGIDSFVFDD